MKDCKTLLWRSKLVHLQICLMIFFDISATVEAYREFHLYGAIVFTIVLTTIYFLAIYSIAKTFSVHPGEVTDDLIMRIRH